VEKKGEKKRDRWLTPSSAGDKKPRGGVKGVQGESTCPLKFWTAKREGKLRSKLLGKAKGVAERPSPYMTVREE